MDRRVILGAALAVLVTLSGCGAILGGDLSYSASQATVSEQALASAHYSEQDVHSQTVNRTFTVAGQTRQVNLTNWMASYSRDTSGGRSPGSVVVFATPTVTIAGQSLNPLGQLSSADLIDRLLAQYGAVGDVQSAGSQQITVLGKNATVSSFRATITQNGQDVPVLVHVTTVKHGDDYVVALAIHPASATAEDAAVKTMFTGIRHAT
ncbi:MAG: DUF6517 family protein [Halanaeroarchaeum sp.]